MLRRPRFPPRDASPSREAPRSRTEAINRAAATTNSASPARLNTANLFAATNEIQIEHGDAVYRLRITSLGKLILTK